MNKIIEKDTVLYLSSKDQNINIDINGPCTLDVYHFVVNQDSFIQINLNARYASVNYYYSIINYDDHEIVIDVLHNEKNTSSNFYNHGVNVLDNSLSFLVNGIVYKDKTGSVCNQENQIMNLSNGNSRICPNLLIDCYDVNSSHSAYIGKFKKDVVFYLESRGIPKEVAYKMLIKGFLVSSLVDEEKISDYLAEIENIKRR